VEIAHEAGPVGTFQWWLERGDALASAGYRRIYGLPPDTAFDTALDAVSRLPASQAQRNAPQGLVGVHRGLCPRRQPNVPEPSLPVPA
jgi:hypothetical protein